MIVRYIVKSYVVFITEKLLKVTENSYVRQDLIMIRIFNIYKNRNFAKLGILPNSVFPNAVTSCTAIITFKYGFQLSSTVV